LRDCGDAKRCQCECADQDLFVVHRWRSWRVGLALWIA
jgi:hypothetical protein